MMRRYLGWILAILLVFALRKMLTAIVRDWRL
jgi:hypothetical protein